MREIQLTRNRVALVDDQDYHFLSQWKWYTTNGGYAQRDFELGGKKSHIYA